MKKGKQETTECLKKERGIWVIRTKKTLPASIVNRMIRQDREERYLLSMGQDPTRRTRSKRKDSKLTLD